MKSSIFVLGGGGFLGRNTIPALIDAGMDVVALQHRSIIPSIPGLQVRHGSLADPMARLAHAMVGCSTILCLAGASTPASSADDPAGDVRDNLLPLLNLLDAASIAGIDRVVFASSGGTIYGIPHSVPIREDHPTMPTCPYGAVKLACEHLIRLWAQRCGGRHQILRISNPYGPHQRLKGSQGVIAAWLSQALARKPMIIWGDGSVVRDYLYVGDVAQGLVATCKLNAMPSGTYNLGSGIGHSLLDIATAIDQTLGRTANRQFEPARKVDIPVNILDSTKFKKTTGWKPEIDLDQGIGLTLSALASAQSRQEKP